MHIAILGATSQIAKDIVLFFATQNVHQLVLFAANSCTITNQYIRIKRAGRPLLNRFSIGPAGRLVQQPSILI